MKLRLNLRLNLRQPMLAAAILAALAPLPFAAMAQAVKPAPATAAAPAAPAATAATPTTPTTPAAKAAVATGTPADWIEYDDLTMTPVLDDVSSHLAAARAALAHKDNAKAAAEMQAAARALEAQAAQAARLERQRAAADVVAAKDVQARMSALTQQLDATAAQIKAGKLNTTAALDQAIGKAQRADLERRWLVTDVMTWYPVADAPQRHFAVALDDYANKDYKAAAAEVRKAAAYVRLEAARAAGDERKELDAVNTALQHTAAKLDKGALASEQELDKVFAGASHALAMAHRARAAESWARKAYVQTGYELNAAAYGLESAGVWAGSQAKAAASSAAAEARAVGDKLASGGVWASDEVAKGFEALGSGLNKVGHAIGAKHKAATIDVGA